MNDSGQAGYKPIQPRITSSLSAASTHIENNRDSLYGSMSLRDKVEAKGVLVCSTGAMEKNIDTIISRRFKKQGMSWTTEGGG